MLETRTVYNVKCNNCGKSYITNADGLLFYLSLESLNADLRFLGWTISADNRFHVCPKCTGMEKEECDGISKSNTAPTGNLRVIK